MSRCPELSTFMCVYVCVGYVSKNVCVWCVCWGGGVVCVCVLYLTFFFFCKKTVKFISMRNLLLDLQRLINVPRQQHPNGVLDLFQQKKKQ